MIDAILITLAGSFFDPDFFSNGRNFCVKKNEAVLVIGDNIRTDIKGANNMKFDSLLITEGIHKNEFLNLSLDNYDKVLRKYNTHTDYYQARLTW